MTEKDRAWIEAVGLSVDDFEPKKQPATVSITREDFDLLDVTYHSTVYEIEEEDGHITYLRGEE